MSNEDEPDLFPLLSTPKIVLMGILKSMEVMDLLSFTLISEKTKQFVHAKEFKPMPIDICVTNWTMKVFVELEIYLFDISLALNSDQLLKIYDVKKALTNLFLLTKQTTVRKLLFTENLKESCLSNAFRYVSICENVTIHPRVLEFTRCKIISQYQNATKQFGLYTIPPVESRNEIVLQNLDYLGLYNDWVFLENLLMANCAALGVNRLHLEVLNKFLKLWIKKRSSSRLEYLWTDRLELDVDMEAVLAGIDYQKVSDDATRIFKLSKSGVMEGKDWLTTTDAIEVRGGYDFRKRDGTRATIAVRDRNRRRRLEFFVWN